MPKISRRHAQTFSSCCLAKSVSSGLTVHGQEEKRRLGVIDPRDTLEEHLLLPEIPARTLASQWEMPQTFTPLLGNWMGNWKERITSPNNCFQVSTLSQPWSSPRSHLVGRHLYSTLGSCHGARGCERVWPIVRLPSCAFIQTLWSTCGVNVIRNAITCSPLMFSWVASRALCCPRANSSGMRGSPCSPLSLCEMYWVMPISSSHKCVDGFP